jgi:hypothetical protein
VASRVTVLVNPANPNMEPTVKEVDAAARSMGLQVRAAERSRPRGSIFDLPVSHDSKIHFADQLGSACLGGFHVGRSLLQGTRV